VLGARAYPASCGSDWVRVKSEPGWRGARHIGCGLSLANVGHAGALREMLISISLKVPSMQSDRYEPFSKLIESFYHAVELYFHFLKSEFDYIESDRLINFGDEYCIYNKDNVPKSVWLFKAKKEYNHNKSGFIITYGDRESIVELKYHNNGYNDIFAVWEIFNANNLKCNFVGGKQFVLNSIFMNDTINSIAEELKSNIEFIIPLSKNTNKIIVLNRNKAILNWKLEREKHEMDQAILKAAEAFRNNNFREVVKLLTKYKNNLPMSQKLKLKFAKRKS